MNYIIIATDDNGLRIEFDKNEQELLFESYEEAQQFMDHIKESKVLPEKKYKFIIEENRTRL
ncbi:hypothetical protein [Halobacillus hunanensis]|uniref:hypothetical protein n=1 Tax=Halobacillus hunanensis TaxID=578214 RepID=UPI0009A61613|nr:hypothetical protein [Halobacillus hunanensis]